MLAAKSFPATADWDTLRRWLRVLADELVERMEEDASMWQRRAKNLVLSYRWVRVLRPALAHDFRDCSISTTASWHSV